jgi:hypothetical protein
MAMPPSLALHLGRVLRRCAGVAADAQLALLPAAARLLEGTLPGGCLVGAQPAVGIKLLGFPINHWYNNNELDNRLIGGYAWGLIIYWLDCWMIEVDCLKRILSATKTMLDINQIEPLWKSLNVGISINNKIPLLGRVVGWINRWIFGNYNEIMRLGGSMASNFV